MIDFAHLSEFLLIGCAAIFALGISAQWIAWKFKVPSLLILLVVGYIAGPVTSYLEPDVIFGELVLPVIELAVGLMLFEVCLGLQLTELKRMPRAVTRLVSVGVIVTFLLTALAARYIVGLHPSVAALLGAIASLSGPSVIIPLLREAPLKGSLASIVRWEGVVLDAVGAFLALLTFEVTYGLGVSDSVWFAIWNILKTLLVGGTLGGLTGFFILVIIRSLNVPDSLKGGACTALLLLGFAFSYIFVQESGLLTAMVAGVFLGNQRRVNIQRYFEFGEFLKVPTFSALFIILAARLPRGALEEITVGALLFVLVLVIFVRPVAVFLSTIGTDISSREKFFLSVFAPRGATAAAIASLFALDLIDIGFPDAERIVPLTFLLIISTVGIYGIGAPLFARLFEVAELNSRGVLILGAHDWARELAKALIGCGLKVLVVDSNYYNVLAARKEDIPARCENIFLDHSLDEVILDGINYFLALTSNSEVNTLASLHFTQLFGPGAVFQLVSEANTPSALPARTRRFQNQILFGSEVTFDELDSKFNSGWSIVVVNAEQLDGIMHKMIPMFAVLKYGQFVPVVAGMKMQFPVGAKIVALVPAGVNVVNNSGSRVLDFPPYGRH